MKSPNNDTSPEKSPIRGAILSHKELKNDNISVIHSSDMDPEPNEEAQEAYDEDETENEEITDEEE